MHIAHLTELSSLPYAIRKDPLSWKDWRCICVFLSGDMNDMPGDTVLETVMQDTVSHCADCTGYVLREDTAMLFCRDINSKELRDIADAIMQRLADIGLLAHYALYNVARDWDAISTVIETAVPGLNLHITDETEGELTLPDMSAYQSIFETNLKTRSAGRQTHVLLVEDEPLTRRMAARVMKDSYRLITAESAEEAITQYCLYAPDIVFLDINLPDGSGFDVLDKLRSYDSKAYIVMFSGNGYLRNLVYALEHGAEGFVTKPFRKEQLEHYIEESKQHFSVI